MSNNSKILTANIQRELAKCNSFASTKVLMNSIRKTDVFRTITSGFLSEQDILKHYVKPLVSAHNRLMERRFKK